MFADSLQLIDTRAGVSSGAVCLGVLLGFSEAQKKRLFKGKVCAARESNAGLVETSNCASFMATTNFTTKPAARIFAFRELSTALYQRNSTFVGRLAIVLPTRYRSTYFALHC